MFRNFTSFLFLIFLFSACSRPDKTENHTSTIELLPEAYNVGFLIMDGVYNTELTAPFDIFHHTRFREGIKPMNVFTVAQTDHSVLTFEGIRIHPDFTFDSPQLPKIDILVVPSAEQHLDSDLENHTMIDFVKEKAEIAEHVISLCDGAFVLAEAGILNNVKSTTFPSDIETYRLQFPELDVLDNVLFVHDEKFITSVGGAKSFEPALYLCEVMYGKEIAKRIAEGLVIDWNLEELEFYNQQKAILDVKKELTHD